MTFEETNSGDSGAMEGVNNQRKAYYVQWRDEHGQMQKIRRMPPPTLHDFQPGDEATVEKRLSEDFPVGEDITIEPASPRNPNVLKLKNSEGQTKFVPYFDLAGKVRRFREIDGERVQVGGADGREDGGSDAYIENSYLEWP